ncbi:uncharacterized protein TNIN_262051 [Trichonephila inaurata madagascariensis]|uniref:Uncharacterized protein n=1 Tax=Trichonephila inaurata madagascariensis TaxID=2747483 RepID=A0A8X7CEG4_9ARAC|nr:uncharacterized protein TNIN_262051 [Trichonephila inaurata madagascariensis]
MRRFFHRKGAQTRTGATNAVTSGQPGVRPRSSSSSTSPNHTPTGRVRAPALRSRSMSVLNGPTAPGTAPTRRFSRSLSFCADNPPISCLSRQLTKTEEDEVFRTYTRRVYGLFGALCAVIVAIAVYAYLHNYGNRS